MAKTTKIIAGLSAVALASAFVVPAVLAVDSPVTVTARLGSTISLSTDVEAVGSLIAGSTAVSKVSASVSTTASNGYALTFKDADTDTNLVGPGTNKIPSISSSGSITGSATGWGYYFGNISSTSGVTFNAIPTVGTAVKTTSAAANSDTSYVSFGIGVSGTTLGSGDYVDVLTFSAAANN
jgi:hypothetical protein